MLSSDQVQADKTRAVVRLADHQAKTQVTAIVGLIDVALEQVAHLPGVVAALDGARLCAADALARLAGAASERGHEA